LRAEIAVWVIRISDRVGEDGAFAKGGIDPDVAAELHRNQSCHGQPEAHAVRVRLMLRRINFRKELEKLAELLLPDSLTTVDDLCDDHLALRMNTHTNKAGVRELESIAHQVEQDLLVSLLVGKDNRVEALLSVEFKDKSFRVHLEAHDIVDLFQALDDVELVNFDLERPVLHLGHVKSVVDHILEMNRRIRNGPQHEDSLRVSDVVL